MPVLDRATKDLFDEVAAESIPSQSSVSADASALSVQSWLKEPVATFVAWAQSPMANGGRGFSENSVKTYASMWGKFVKFRPSNTVLADAGQIEVFLNTLSARTRRGFQSGRGPENPLGIRRRYLAMLDQLFDSLVADGVRLDNPAKRLLFMLDVTYRAVPRHMPVALAKKDEVTVIEVIDSWDISSRRGLRDRAVLALLAGAGLKVGEVLGLRVEDVRLHDDPPNVQVANRKNERLAPVAVWAVSHIAAWLQLLGADGDLGGAVFPGDDASPLAACTVYRIVASAIKKAKLNPKHVGPSVLRHTYAVRQLRAGTKLSTVSAWLGHVQETSTAVYRLMVVDPEGARPV
jgi:site-specific recombinase XerD